MTVRLIQIIEGWFTQHEPNIPKEASATIQLAAGEWDALKAEVAMLKAELETKVSPPASPASQTATPAGASTQPSPIKLVADAPSGGK